MDLKDFVAVSGFSGLYKMAANRSNGLIIEDLDSGKKRFASSRKHQFTPLESIAIFIDDEDDSTELANVFQSMKDKQEELPVVATNKKAEDLRAYFKEILPNYDRDRVSVSDIKKVIKWFNYLNDRNLLIEKQEPTSDEEE